MRRIDQKTTSMGLLAGDMGQKSRDSQKAHLGPLLNVRNKFQLPSSIWTEDREEIAFFQIQKRETPISPLLIDLKG